MKKIILFLLTASSLFSQEIRVCNGLPLPITFSREEDGKQIEFPTGETRSIWPYAENTKTEFYYNTTNIGLVNWEQVSTNRLTTFLFGLNDVGNPALLETRAEFIGNSIQENSYYFRWGIGIAGMAMAFNLALRFARGVRNRTANFG